MKSFFVFVAAPGVLGAIVFEEPTQLAGLSSAGLRRAVVFGSVGAANAHDRLIMNTSYWEIYSGNHPVVQRWTHE